MSSPGLLNNRYQIEGRIGSGGMAEVYRARDLMLERTVAVKLLREDFRKTLPSASASGRKPKPQLTSPILISSQSMILASMTIKSLLSWNISLVLI